MNGENGWKRMGTEAAAPRKGRDERMETDGNVLENAVRDDEILWRLNNLYRITDENGREVIFRMREAQLDFYRRMWRRNVVLKARQLGFTTLIDLIGLDMALWTPNCTCVIIAETDKKAKEIMEKKIVYPYEHLPEDIRNFVRVETQEKGRMSFSNGSTVIVSTSARSWTAQFLHVSEYGPICARNPRKGDEILTGSFPAVHQSGYIFVESTAMGNEGHFYDMVMQAEAKELRKETLSALDFRLHFYPWHRNRAYRIRSEAAVPARLLKYFDSLYDLYGITLDEEQQKWYAAEEQVLKEKMWAEYPSYAAEAFKTARDGAYYGVQFSRIYRENRITFVPYDEALPVHTSWDLGMSDETAIWFFQFFGKEIRVIDYYQNDGEGLAHYVSVLREKGYRYGRHFAPHDIEVRELGSGLSRRDSARGMGLDLETVPTNRDVPGGIENVRQMLDHCFFDDSRTEEGRKCLENYRREWDDKHGVYRDKPLHDQNSHGADAFRTMAVAWKLGRLTDQNGLPSYGRGESGPSVRIRGGLKKF